MSRSIWAAALTLSVAAALSGIASAQEIIPEPVFRPGSAPPPPNWSAVGRNATRVVDWAGRAAVVNQGVQYIRGRFQQPPQQPVYAPRQWRVSQSTPQYLAPRYQAPSRVQFPYIPR
ncbi:MAG: hypothetical protein JWM87_2506 [Candidatus Eremiobacteraeota bacterium]|nr:hypothetical protein [Candidatus Eremiobacteraeota bacterium]